MEISPIAQARLMLFCAVLGVAVGVYADVFSELCLVFPKRVKGIIRFLSDFCGVGVTFAGMIVLSFYFDKGRIRFFDFLGMTLGFVLYRATLSHLARWIFRRIVGLILQFFKLLGIPCVFLLRKIKKCIKICQYYIRKSLEKNKYMLYNIYNNIIILKWAESGFLPRRKRK